MDTQDYIREEAARQAARYNLEIACSKVRLAEEELRSARLARNEAILEAYDVNIRTKDIRTCTGMSTQRMHEIITTIRFQRQIVQERDRYEAWKADVEGRNLTSLPDS